MVEEHPTFYCVYYNEDDERTCICLGYDKFWCYKPSCSPNVATMGGKILLFVYIVSMLLFIVLPILIYILS